MNTRTTLFGVGAISLAALIACGHGDPLVVTKDEPAGANCPAGGTKVSGGIDKNRNGVLEPREVQEVHYVCDGANGEDGKDGRNGGAGLAGFRLISKFTGPNGPIAEIVAATPDGETLAFTSSTSQTVGFVDISDALHPVALGDVNVAGTVSTGNGEATAVAITPNGQYALIAVKDTTEPIGRTDPGALVFVDVASRGIVGSLAIGVGPDSLHITPDGGKVLIAIEDEEDGDNNALPQQRPGSVQIVTIDYAAPASSTVSTVALAPDVGNQSSDPQPEFVEITPDGATAIVSLQENNVIALIDIAGETVVDYIDVGSSSHARADLSEDGEVAFSDPGFRGLLEPDSVCVLSDGQHFVTANEGDTPNFGSEPGLWSGGRGFSIFNLDGTRVYDSGDSAEWLAVRAGAYPEARSQDRGVELEGCASGVFAGTDYAFLLGERNASLYVVNVSDPANPVLSQMLGAPMRPEGALAIPERNLVVVSGEGDGVGGGIWLYQGTTDPTEIGNGPDVYDTRSTGTGYGALGALAYDAETDLLLATPDNAFAGQRIWFFWADHGARRMELVRELGLTDFQGEPLTGYDPEGIAKNPEGGYILAVEGLAGNGGSTSCVGSADSNRLLFVNADGALDPAYGNSGIVDLPCGADPNAIDWTTVRANGFEGVTVVDAKPGEPGGLKVYAAVQRALIGEGQNTRIGEYDVDAGAWNFYFYPLDANGGGAQGNTFLSELIHVGGDKFAVIERDQGWAGEALNKTIRTFTLSSGTPNDITNPVDKALAYDLLAHPFRFDQEKIEGMALGAQSLWVVNDNDGGEAMNFFLKLDPSVIGATVDGSDPVVPGQDSIEINEVRSDGSDFVELVNLGTSNIDLGGWKLTDDDPTHVFVIPSGTSIAPGGFVLLEGAAGAPLELTFGLGATDAVRLFTPFELLVSEHVWAGTHQNTASRCESSFGVSYWNGTAATPGAPNDCTPPLVLGTDGIVINEVNSQGDYVELLNIGSAAVDVSGWLLTDNDETHAVTLPPGTIIPAGGFLVIDDENSGAPITLSFGLGAGDSAILYTPFGTVVHEYTWTVHQQAGSRCPDGTGSFVFPTVPSKGGPNACP